jgi:hypothetical protein
MSSDVSYACRGRDRRIFRRLLRVRHRRQRRLRNRGRLGRPGRLGNGAQRALGTAWNVYDSIPGWTTVSGFGIEVQRGTVIAPNSGAFYVELDSHPNATNSGSTNTRMSQNLGALALGVYDLSFYYSPRTSNATSMDIAFDLAGGAAFADTVGFVDGAVGSWTQITRSFAVTSGADVVLSFAAGGDGGSARRLHR